MTAHSWSFICSTGAIFLSAGSIAAGTLPVPCAPVICGANGPSKFLTSGSATATQTSNTLTVTQTTNQAALNWASFDIAANNKVVFKQPTSSAIALNRIYAANPSSIFGSLQANGQIYLINLNGFLFGKTSTVNVNNLLVSTLPMADSTFQNGILSPLPSNTTPALGTLDSQTDASFGVYAKDPFAAYGSARMSVLDLSGKPVLDANGNPLPVQIVVAPGAQMSAASGGRLLLAGQSVTNGGSLSAPDGQVILAAGQSIFLQASTDASLRGLIVEVDSGTTAANLVASQATNQVTNQASGAISTPRGNTTLVGLAVNQDGIVSATTTVAANGSIRLEAADTVQPGSGVGGTKLVSSHGGTLTIGASSDLSVLPEVNSTASEVDQQAQLPSTVTLLGEQVIMQGGTITAPSGQLTVTAAANPSMGVATDGNTDARLRIDAGTKIDLSGSEATLPVAANLVTVQLRANELAGDPTQRNGALRGQTIVVDARSGSPLIANVSSEIAAVPKNIAQRTESGGTAVFQSEGDIVVAAKSSINVSGGATEYLGGQMQTSELIGADGRLYPVATANPLLKYVGVVNPTYTQTFDSWGIQEVKNTPGLSSYQAGYVQGAAAGSVQFAAPNLVLSGQLIGTAVNGPYQRTPSTAVSGGRLVIGLQAGLNSAADALATDYLAPAVSFVTTPTPVVVADDTPLPGPQALQLPMSYLTNGGFSSTQIFSNFGITLPKGLSLTLLPGSSLSLEGSRVDVLSSITAPEGSLSFLSALTVDSTVAGTARGGVYVGDDVTLDVRGRWTNDALGNNSLVGNTSLPPIWQNGGSINIGLTDASGSAVSIGDDVALRASGGAWLEANGAVIGGQGGHITINAGGVQSALSLGSSVSLDAFGVNGANGGSFTLDAPRISIANGSGSWTTAQSIDDLTTPGGVFAVYAPLFSKDGFTSITLNAAGLIAPGATSNNVLSVAPGTTIDAVAESLILAKSSVQRASGGPVEDFATVTPLPPYQRFPVSISLTAIPSPFGQQNQVVGSTTIGDVDVGAGASIVTGATGKGTGTGSITLTSTGSLLLEGSLIAPGGAVNLKILAPSASYDVAGFLPDQRLELAGNASINVAGTVVTQPSDAGLLLGTVFAGGEVNLSASRGAVQTDPGSFISIAGASAPLDVQQPTGAFVHTTVGSAGGSLAVESGEAISLLGALDAHAGSGSTGTLAAGSLSVELSQSEDSVWAAPPNPQLAATYPSQPLTISLVGSTSGQAPVSSASNTANIGVAQIVASGIDSLTLEAGDSIDFQPAPPLLLGRSLTLNAPAFSVTSANASVSAPYVSIGSSIPAAAAGASNPPAASSGSGVLKVSGDAIDIVGNSVVQGAGSVSLISTGDMRLLGTNTATSALDFAGSFSVGGNLSLSASRIYPNTGDVFAINAGVVDSTGAINGGAITVGQSNPNPGTPLSAGASLTLTADTLSSTGTLLAPFGTIALNAAKSLTLGNGSLTSVSGAGMDIPFGQTLFGGLQWIYAATSNISITGVPNRAVSLTSDNLKIAPHATVDVSGGGNLSAYEWVPGTGGPTDALAPGVTPGLYAVLPSLVNLPSPADPQESNGSTLAPNASIYLSGGGGLAAGTYALLPARYALLPNAFLVQVVSGFQSTSGGVVGALADGTPVVAGYLTYGSTGLHQTSGYSGVAIRPGSYGQELAAYNISLASNFFSAAATAAGSPRPTLPADAGSLILSVGKTLDAEGTVLTAAATGGLGASIDVSATDLYVGASASGAPAGSTFLSDATLNNWHAGSLLLGGQTANGGIDVSANRVTVGSGAAVSADQVVIVAAQSIDLRPGASLSSTSAGSNGVAPASLPTASTLTLTGVGDGTAALLAVSDLALPIVDRAASQTTGGTILIEGSTSSLPAASVASRGALSFDGPGGVTLLGTLSGQGAAWSLASDSIAFASGTTSSDALTLSPAITHQLGAAGSVRLASSGAIDLLTPVNLGVSIAGGSLDSVSSANALKLNSLTLSAAVLNNQANGSSSFGAQTIVLEGAAGAATVPESGPSSSTLSLAAGELDIGPGLLSVHGFGSTTAKVFGAVIGQGNGGVTASGNLSLNAGELTASAGAQTAIDAEGVLAVGSVPIGATTKLPDLLAGVLTLSGESIDVSGNIQAPAGLLNLISTAGTSIDKGAILNVAGQTIKILNQTFAAPGGALSIEAGGALSIAAGATLNASGAGSANAGSITLGSGGLATVGATLSGRAGAGAAGGAFVLDANALAGGAGINGLTSIANLLSAGGFTQQIDIRVHSGDLLLASGSQLTANQVSLDSDSGNVTIAGTLSARSASSRGSLQIFGGTGVELASGGVLSAAGTAANERGGDIEIGEGMLVNGTSSSPSFATGSGILLDAGSSITTQGSAAAGTLLLRAPALQTSNDVAIGSINSSLAGIGTLTVEPVIAFGTANFSNPAAPTAADWSSVQASIAGYMATAGTAIAARLGSAGGSTIFVTPGAEVVAPGDLTIGAGAGLQPALELSPGGSNWRFGPANRPVDLTVLATGNLTVAATISDGFSTDQSAKNTPQTVLSSGAQAGPSASIRLVAGADLASADPLATTRGAAGTLTLDDGAVVRTGTGEIDLIAAANISVGGGGAGAYTAGAPAIAAGGTADNPYPNSPAVLGVGTAFGIQVRPSSTSALFSFPTDGGQLVVRAGQDIVGTPLAQGSVSNWQLREGGAGYSLTNPDGTLSHAIAPAQWGVNLAAYNWNFGTLGGGDLQITAAHDIVDVTAAAAGSRIGNPNGNATLVSSGGLSVFAGNDIATSQLFLADGKGSVTADGALTAILRTSTGTLAGSAIYLQDSSVAVQARLGISVDGLYNPTSLGQPIARGLATLAGNYFSYGAGSGVSLTTTSGDVQIGGAGGGVAAAILLGANVAGVSSANAQVFPGTLEAVALGGNLYLGGATGTQSVNLNATLFPDALGQLNIVASGNIAGGGSVSGQTNILMSDAPLASIPTVANPGVTGAVKVAFNGLLHTGDAQPALLTAGGDISELNLSIPKASETVAGRDIVDFALSGQNLSAADLTLISAGRDIVYENNCTSGCGIQVGGPGRLDLVAGRNVNLAFSTGITTDGNILNANLPTPTGADLTVQAGAGTSPDYAAVVANLISPTNTASDLKALAAVPAATASGFSTALSSFLSSVVSVSPAYQWNFEYFVRNFITAQAGKDPGVLTFAQAKTAYSGFTPTVRAQWLGGLKEVMQVSGTEQGALVKYVENVDEVANLSFDAAAARFAMLSPNAQRPFADQLFFSELGASGLDDNVLPGVGFSRGYAAIDTLYPNSRASAPDAGANPYAGDITLVFSRIYTLSGGNVSLLAPGGLLNVGLANPPGSLVQRDPSTLGIVAEGAGNVSIYSAGDVLVSSSRIFTLGGGNILIWSNEGSIDAGQGAKSAVSAPPPALLINANGTVTLNFAGAATGSGIRTIQTDPNAALGDVSLIAPVGTVNAGDAGIGAAGNINIAAQRVLGLDNIQFGGASTGVPAQVSSLGASLSAVSNAAGATTQASTGSVTAGESRQSAAVSLSEAALSWLDVFVTGLGEENCDVKDIDCIKRQKSSMSH